MSALTVPVASLLAHWNESSPRSANTSAGGSASAAENSSRSKANATAALPVENDGLVHGPDVPGPQFRGAGPAGHCARSEEHTSELQSLMRISYAVFCLK